MNKYMKSTTARLEMLERKNRWLTIIAIATIITLLIAVAGGPAVIRASSIQLIDENGNVRAEQPLADDVVRVYSKDKSGHDRPSAAHDAGDNVANHMIVSAADR